MSLLLLINKDNNYKSINLSVYFKFDLYLKIGIP